MADGDPEGTDGTTTDTDASGANTDATADPQAAIDDASSDRRTSRPQGFTAGDTPEGIPFIGAGPGDPGLLTVTGRELCEAADLVVHAGSLVNSELLEAYCAEAETVSSIGKDLEELIPLMHEAYEGGETVVRLHSGDPAIYGAALEQMDALEAEGVPAYFVPGVTSAFAASATLRTQLTLNGIANHVAFTRPQGKTLDPEEDHIGEFVEMGDVTTCIYLGTHAVSETMDRLLEAGHDPETPVTVVYHASWPDEDVIEGSIGTIGEKIEAAGYRASALVIIGEAVGEAGYDRSYLYDGWASRGPDSDGAEDAVQEADD